MTTSDKLCLQSLPDSVLAVRFNRIFSEKNLSLYLVRNSALLVVDDVSQR
jgi:hypothetical protein